MRHAILCIAFALTALPCVPAQTVEPEFVRGKAEELRGVSKVFVSPGQAGPITRDRIIKTIRDSVPQLTFVATQEEADVWLWFSSSRETETGRRSPDPSGQQSGPPEFTSESVQIADGRILLAPKPGSASPKIVGRFRRSGDGVKGLSEKFAKEFVRMYRKANSEKDRKANSEKGLSSGNRPRPEAAPPRLNKNEPAPPAPAASQARAPSSDGQEGEDEVVRVDSTLVTIPASVLARDGKYVTNLRKEDFRVYEDGVEQDVSFFATVDAPFTVALLIDTSASTRAHLKDIVAAANAVVDQLRPDDQLIVVSFDFEIRELVKAAKIRDVRNQGISIEGRGGTTRLYDAVDFVVKERLRHVKGRKAIILLTDGVDGGSVVSLERSVSDIEESDILVYPVRYDTYEETIRQIRAARPGVEPPANRIRKTYERGSQYLGKLAELTGGRFHQVEEVGSIARVFALIVDELSRQYSLGYYPRTSPEEGQRRRIRVRVNLPNLAVRARDSYVVTSSGAGEAIRK